MQEHEHYAYIYLDPTRKGIFETSVGTFFYEPFYVGKGSGKRIDDHLQNLTRCHNTAMRGRTRKLHETNPEWPYRMKVATFDNASAAYDLEEKLISELGSRFVSQIKDGPLLNMSAGGWKPRSQKGRTYEEIYGDRAEEQKAKRNALQKAAGGWFKGGRHTAETKAKLAASHREKQKDGGYRTGISHTVEDRAKIAATLKSDPRKRNITLIADPSGKKYLVFRMSDFCVEMGVSKSTIDKAYRENWDGIKSGKTKGWRKLMAIRPSSILSDFIEPLLDSNFVYWTEVPQSIKDQVVRQT